MKAGTEIHFIAGQLFTLGVAALTVGPRMPFDAGSGDRWSVGGRLSTPFRYSLLGLVILGMTRVVICHILFPGLVSLDSFMGMMHVLGQSFLCLTTAYLLQIQLSEVINITPGRSLMNIQLWILILTISAFLLGRNVHDNFDALEHAAEALSCYGVLQTLKTYSSVTAPGGRGPYLTQLVQWTEYWFLVTSLLTFLCEASHGFLLTKFHHDAEDHPIVVLLESVRQNQDSGVDSWTRLLIHSVFLNSLDELQHFTGVNSAQNADSSTRETTTPTDATGETGGSQALSIMRKGVRSRQTTGSVV